MVKKRGLGDRGLSALLRPREDVEVSAESSSAEPPVRELPVEFLQRGRYQPRKDMDPAALEELADSIAKQGIVQPVVVRPLDKQRYEIIAGERRWRAAQLAGLTTVPVYVRDVPDDAAIAMSLIENIQREDLNPVEEATAYQRLQEEFELTQQEVAEAVGKSRSTVTNLMRLLKLDIEVRTLLEHGDIEMGHARALLALPNERQWAAARLVVSRGLSVRQTEAMVRRLLASPVDEVAALPLDPNIGALQEKLAQKLGAAVSIRHGPRGGGRLVIKYTSLSELDGILAHMS